MSDYQKLSSDLSRVAEFLLMNNQEMAKKFTDLAIQRYSHLPGKIGGDDIGDYLNKIQTDPAHAAERAMTASTILANRVQ